MTNASTNTAYKSILDTRGIIYKEDKYYLKIGQPTCPHGWILHISLKASIKPEQLSPIIDNLLGSNFPFKIIKTKALHDTLNTGGFGSIKTGKSITVYLDKPENIANLLESLIPLTEKYAGPVILTDFPIRQSLYTRYGSFTHEIEKDAFGNLIVTMKDNAGNKVEDCYRIPPIFPTGAPNHFIKYIDPNILKKKSPWIGNKVLPLKLLKQDLKGNVWIGIYIGPKFKVKICAIKQGIKGMFEDLNGRDMFDRMESQKYIINSIKDKVRSPRLIDAFTEGRKSYIVLSYIWFGKDLINIIRKKIGNIIWHKQPINIKKLVLDYYIKIVDQIILLHEAGFVHRDITGTNFFIDRLKRIHLIDLELSYSYRENKPNPPFRGGTPGYMAARLTIDASPTPKDDSYSLGSLLLMIIAGGIEPASFLEPNSTSVYKKILFLSNAEIIASIINKCLSPNPTDRPELGEIKNAVSRYKKELEIRTNENTPLEKDISITKITYTLIKATSSLQSPIYSEDNIWLSQKENQYSIDVYPTIDSHAFGALYRGIGGIIIFYSLIKKCGIEIRNSKSHIDEGITFIIKTLKESQNDIDPSYYFGLAGMALALKQAIQSGFLEKTAETMALIENCFTKTSLTNSFGTGTAGQIIAAMQCNEMLHSTTITTNIRKNISSLIDQQHPNGMWNNLKAQSPKESIILGFGYGIAGTAYTLLEYGHRFNDSIAIRSAEKGLSYVTKYKVKQKEKIGWPIDTKSKIIGHDFINGTPGVILSFLRAYEITRHKPYLILAENALQSVHPFLIYTNLTQALGMSGIGEVYLEAFRITQNQEWLDRATWIIKCLLRLKMTAESKEVFWLSNGPIAPTADFMIGSSGILHFLLRYLNPEKINFPFLPSAVKV